MLLMSCKMVTAVSTSVKQLQKDGRCGIVGPPMTFILNYI